MNPCQISIQNIDFCTSTHPHEDSCNIYHISRYIEGLKIGAKVYFPVHLLPLILYKRKQIMEKPLEELGKFVFGLAKSLGYISCMISFLRFGLCYMKYFPQQYKYLPAMFFSFVGSMGLIIESNSRACEISLYIVPRFFQMVLNFLESRKYNVKFQYGDILVFSVIMAILHYYYQHQCKCIKSTYRSVFSQFWGKN